MRAPTALTVTQLNRFVKSLLEGNSRLEEVLLKGEISNLSGASASGHLYLTLKDGGAAIKAVMFRGNAQFLRFTPQNGMAVLVTGSVSLYERDGSYQFYITSMQPDGMGALQLAYEQSKAKLLAEGVFDSSRKRPLPTMPTAIYLVTSATGAAFQDVCSVMGRRFPSCTIKLLPVTVQGRGAAPTILAAFDRIRRERAADLVILCRGGGSLEDLWAFNEEPVVRAVAACPLPVVAAIGHETDFTLAEFAADLRAPTPSAAAELSVPDRQQLLDFLSGRKALLERMAQQLLRREEERLDRAAGGDLLVRPQNLLNKNRQKVDYLVKLLDKHRTTVLSEQEKRLKNATALLDSVSPLRVLARGYSVTRKGGQVITAADQVQPGDLLETDLAVGKIYTKVVSADEKEADL